MLSTNLLPYVVYLLFYMETKRQASTFFFNPVTDAVYHASLKLVWAVKLFLLSTITSIFLFLNKASEKWM